MLRAVWKGAVKESNDLYIHQANNPTTLTEVIKAANNTSACYWTVLN